MNDADVQQASSRAAAWILDDNGFPIERSKAINEELLAFDVTDLIDERAKLQAEIKLLRLEIMLWEAIGAKYDIKLREVGCKCHREEGDSPCPVHPGEDAVQA